MEITDIWRDGHPLDEAWWFYFRPDAKLQYEEAGTERRTIIARNLMRSDLLLELKAGKISAFGILKPYKPGDKPSLIDSIIFENAEIDWENSSIKALGIEYERVKLPYLPKYGPDRQAVLDFLASLLDRSATKTEAADTENVSTIIPEVQNVKVDVYDPDFRGNNNNGNKHINRAAHPSNMRDDNINKLEKSKKIGRPAIVPLLVEIIRNISSDVDFVESQQKARIAIVVAAARDRHPERFGKSGPGRTSVLNALNQAGFGGPVS